MTSISCLMLSASSDERKMFLKASILSALRVADEIIFCDPHSGKDAEWVKTHFSNYPQIKIIYDKWEDTTSFTKIRNNMKKYATKEWILNLDLDEVLSDDAGGLIQEHIKNNLEIDCWNLLGVHYFYNLNFIDASIPEHIWRGRLFKNIPDIKYNDKFAHGLPIGYKKEGKMQGYIIHHYGYCKGTAKDLERYDNNMNKREIHTIEELQHQLISRAILGNYPVAKLNSIHFHPSEIKELFHFRDLGRWLDV